MNNAVLRAAQRPISRRVPEGGRISHWFLALILIEGVLGGAGRFLVFGPVTLKMVLFAVAVVASFATILFRQRIDRDTLVWTLSFGTLISLAALVGTLNGAMASTVADDLSPQLSFLALPFFLQTIRNASDVDFVSRVIRVSCVLLGVVSLFVFIALWSGYLPFSVMYTATLASAEIFWRSSSYSFFYKGFMYLAVGVAFFIPIRNSIKFPIIFLFVTDAVFSATRGLLLAEAAVFIGYMAIVQKNWLLIGLQAVLLIGIIYTFSDDYNTIVGNRDESDEVRVVQANEVASEMTAFSLLIGHGFGQGTDSRPTRMELTYAEIFHKQGVVGLAFWASVLLTVISLYRKARMAGHNRMAMPYLLSVIAVYTQSLTNPFLNNPIGIMIIVVSLATLRALAGRAHSHRAGPQPVAADRHSAKPYA